MSTARAEFLAGVRAELPILLGAAPFGMIYGAAAVKSGLTAGLAQAMSAVVFAGAAQFVTVQLLATGTPALIILLTGLILNLRHVLYSASLAPYLGGLSRRWRAVLAYLLTDEAYVVTIIHYERQGGGPQPPWFMLGAGLTLWSMWQVSTAIGVFLGAQVPASWPLDFALPLTFIALLVPRLKDRASVGAALGAGIVAVLAAGLPLNLGLAVAVVAGLAVALALGRKGAA